MTAAQRDLLMKLLDVYIGKMAADIAEDRLARVRKAGVEKIGVCLGRRDRAREETLLPRAGTDVPRSSTTTPRTTATTSTRCGATSTATSGATCCASTFGRSRTDATTERHQVIGRRETPSGLPGVSRDLKACLCASTSGKSRSKFAAEDLFLAPPRSRRSRRAPPTAVRRRRAPSRAERTTSRCRTAAGPGPTTASALAEDVGEGQADVLRSSRSSSTCRARTLGQRSATISASRKQAGAEVRDDDRHLRMAERDRVQIERVAEADVERARQPELLAHADRQHAAVHEHRRARRRRRDVEDAPSRDRPESSSGAWRGTGRSRAGRRRAIAVGGLRGGVRLRRIHHEEADEPLAMTADGGGDRRRVARHARDQRRARHLMAIELRDPAIGERLRPFPARPSPAWPAPHRRRAARRTASRRNDSARR